MCNDAVRNNPAVFFLVPDHFKTQDMCIKALEADLWSLYDVPDHLKTQSMCDDAIKDDPSSPQFVPDWFVTQEQLHIWYDDKYWSTMVILVSGIKVIKNARLKKQRLMKNSYLMPDILIVWWIGACQNTCGSNSCFF